MGFWGDPNARQVLDYYFSRQEQGERPLNEVKLLLVGRGEAGKSCVSRALRGLDFKDGHEETPGIEIHPWELDCPGADPVKVHLWDFAGQEITHETHRFFLTERSLYVVVLDGRTGKQMEEAEYWLSHVERYGSRRIEKSEQDGGHRSVDAEPGGTKRADPKQGDHGTDGAVPSKDDREHFERSPVIVVLNKWESPGRYDVEKQRLRREYPNIKSFVETDCMTRLGFEDGKLKETIRTVLEDMPGVRQPWANSYYEVRQLLEAKIDEGEHFVTWDAFRELCAKGGEEDEGRQHSMAENLNALGVALYYGEDDRLRDTRVLNPNWAANGLYGLVRGVNQKPHQGEPGHLWTGNLAEVLAAGMEKMESARGARIVDYPEERNGVKVHEFLLNLMLDRELGFQAGMFQKKPRYLLPGLLAVDEPEPEVFDISELMEAAEVKFRYVYEILPAGVMSRLIVRTHPLSEGEGLHRWKRGVTLKWGGATGLAIVESKPVINVFIRGGTAEERQNLAGIVRMNFKAIHDGLPDGLHGVEELEVEGKYQPVADLLDLEKADQAVRFVKDGSPLDVPVTPELERVQPAAARGADPAKLKVFVSYANANYQAWNQFRVHLDVLLNENLVSWWFDGKIRPSEKWDTVIRRKLKEADIIVLLMSNEFFASKYIHGVELEEAKRRHEAGVAVVLPVSVAETPAFGEHPWLGSMQAVPKVGGRLRAVQSFNRHDTGWTKVQVALRKTIADVAGGRGR